MCKHMYIFSSFVYWKGLEVRNPQQQWARSTPILASNIKTFSKKWPIPEMGQANYEMNFEHYARK